jgi:hypothetical protein
MIINDIKTDHRPIIFSYHGKDINNDKFSQTMYNNISNINYDYSLQQFFGGNKRKSGLIYSSPGWGSKLIHFPQ